MSTKHYIKTAILGITLILSVALVIRWLNGEHMLPWKTQIQLHRPQQIIDGNDGFFILDNGYHRLLHLTAENKVDEIITCNGPKSIVDGIYLLHSTDSVLYMAGDQIREGGGYSKNELFLKYDYASKEMETLYTIQFGDSDRIIHGGILDLWRQSDSLYYVKSDKKVCELYALPLATKDEEINSVLLQTVEMPEPIIRGYHTSDGFILVGKYCHAWEWKHDNLRETDYEQADIETELSVQDGEAFMLAFGIIFYNILFLLAIVFIVLLLIYFVNRLIRQLHSDKENGKSHRGRDAIILTTIALLIAGFYTRYMYQDYLSGYFKQICSLREQIEYLTTTDYADVLEGISTQDKTYLNDSAQIVRLKGLNDMMQHMTQCPSLQNDVYSDIFIVSNDGAGLNIADANDEYVFGDMMSTSDEVKHILSHCTNGQPFKIWDIDGFYYASVVPANFNGKTFCIEVGCYIDNVKDASAKMVLSLFFKLLILFLFLYTIVGLSKKLPNRLRTFRQYKQNGREDAGVWLSGVLGFLFYAIYAIDQGVMVYLVYSLSEGCTPAQMALRASIPMLLYMGIGMSAYLIQPALRKWFGDRWVNMGAGILAVGVFAMMAVGVTQGSFVIYCIGKALTGMLGGFIFNSTYALPLIAKDHNLRNEGLAAITVAGLGANILFISLGGFISQYFGYSAVYIVSALMSVAVILVAAIVYPKGKATGSEEENTKETAISSRERVHKVMKFLTSGKMITYYLGVLLPFGMMNAYSYYLYPIYAENAGISVSELANMIVFGYAFAYIFGEKLVRWKNKRNGLWVLLNVIVIMAVLEITFTVAGNIYWATLVLMISCVMIAIPRSEANVFIAEESKRNGLDVRDTNSGFSFALDATEAVASPLMGWCVSMGLVVGTNIIGAISLVLTSIFAFWHRRTLQEEDSK